EAADAVFGTSVELTERDLAGECRRSKAEARAAGKDHALSLESCGPCRWRCPDAHLQAAHRSRRRRWVGGGDGGRRIDRPCRGGGRRGAREAPRRRDKQGQGEAVTTHSLSRRGS